MSRLNRVVFDSLTLKQQSGLEEILCSENAELFQGYRTTALQSPLAAKNLHTARKIAGYILGENNEIDTIKLIEATNYLIHCTYPLGPHRHNEAKAREHLLCMLKALKENPNLKNHIKALFIPSYTAIQHLIRHTLALDSHVSLSVFHVRQAVLTALFTYLRQDVGSCFATATAILIHQEYPERFLKDIDDLLSSGKLSRVIGTREITVPINLSGCIGELFKPLHILDLYPDPLRKLSSSPGLQKAFQAAGILETLSDPQIHVQQLLAHEYLLNKIQNAYETITANEIIESTLLHYYQISKNTVRSILFKEGLFSKEQLLLNSQFPHELSETHKVYRYLSAYEEAKFAFVRDTQNPLLKAWEYTLATFADANQPTAANHIRIALGWHNDGPQSLVGLLKTFAEEEIETLHTLVQQCEQTYHEARAQLAYIESRMRSPLNNQDSQILTMDHIRFRQELNKALYDWDSAQEKAKQFAVLPDFLISFYTKQIPLYFRSSYDAFIQEFAHLYADTPAGFRIFFTHGRTHPHAWSPIYSINEFIRFLSEFFTSTEIDLLSKHAVIGLEKETTTLIHRITALLHKESFQEAALQRILQAYDLPIPESILHHLDKISHMPWVYVSGGTVTSLLTDYFEHTEPLTIIEKYPENAHELAAFFADALKDLPTGIKNYLEEGTHSLIASSPTHVFSITAGAPLFKEAWDNDWYSYTWLRDIWMKQHNDFLYVTTLSHQGIYTFIERFCNKYALQDVVQNFHNFCSDYTLTLPEFYEKASRFLQQLYRHAPKAFTLYQRYLVHQIVNDIPYVSEQQLPEILDNISSYLGISSRMAYDNFSALIEQHVPKLSLLSSADVRHLYKGLLMESYQKLYTEEDMYLRLATAMRHHNLAYPAPLLFGDTNWPYSYFGFIVNPGTQQIDLWQFNYAGLQGYPLNNIEEILSLQQPWTLYSNPIDYGMPPPPGYRSHMPKGFF
ncbi:hypothetical protein [Candidatus Chlamydia sanziniae]|uniref:Putative succinate dehydrogenase membrane anhor protein n=1 Tax=Candidatus Chlamydia sanziniae TaxID=1806891 RepID=A0A1A9HWX0_9CHLA|nr:hypothetical protein [Candidatus Chlamydia sanziniae]ANH78592.1 putative succinate dehydrogenase membrane anhor protein [Candidatus Chlamydia sanziniae]